MRLSLYFYAHSVHGDSRGMYLMKLLREFDGLMQGNSWNSAWRMVGAHLMLVFNKEEQF